MDPTDQTGDDGLTEGERAEAAADAAGTATGTAADPAADAAAETAAATAAAEKTAADAAAAAAAEEPKPDKGAAALEAAAAALTRVADTVAAQNAPKPEAPTEKPRDFAAEKVALKEQLDKGEIDEDAYDAKREKILEDAADFRADQRIATRMQQQREADVQANWETTVDSFSKDPTNAKLYDSPVRNAAFNAMVHIVAKELPRGSHTQWLTEARDRVLKEFGFNTTAADPAATAAALKKAQDERDAAAGKKPPVSIAQAPAAGAGDMPSGHQQLDSLPISDLEDAMARLPADKLEEYLAAAPGGLKDNPKAV